ncbi:MAG: hypothetical protein CVU31_03960 [Betaproteobacteria bacterium HGW-Betaproteobacteria-4]|nr:MAG: hypothetical protein CVU31_03960 [Betaproteobacteria bacterium HGW-Betaproteobacteria-4]
MKSFTPSMMQPYVPRANMPAVPGLKAGQMVGAHQSDIFDYLRVFPDGRTEGNETSKLLK